MFRESGVSLATTVRYRTNILIVSDYTHGPLNMAVYVVPSLQVERESSVAANCLLNTPIWRDDEEFCHK